MQADRRNFLPYAAGLLLVARRDLLSLLRSPWTFALVGILVALLGVGAYLGLPRSAATSTAVSAFARQGYLAYQGYLIGIAIFVLPGLAAILVSAERSANTLEQLRVSCLSCGQIVLGKVAAALAVHALLCAATLPVAGMVYFFAGVDLWSMLALPLYLGPFSLCCASTGLNMGLRRGDLPAAWLSAIGLLALISLMFFAVAAAITFVPVFPLLAPLAAPVHFLVWAMPMLLLSRRWLRIDERRTGEPEPEAGRDHETHPFRLMEPIRSSKARFIRDDGNPVYQKEQWVSQLSAGSYTGHLWVLGAIWGFLALLPQPGIPGSPGILRLGFLELILVYGAAPGLAVLLLAQERESGTLVHLRLSALSAREVLWGKVSVLLTAVLPVFIAVFVLQGLFGVGIALVDRAAAGQYSFALYLLHLSVYLAQAIIRLPAYTLLALCCALPGTLLARTTLNAQVLGYGGAILGVVVFELLRGSALAALPVPAGGLVGIDLLIVAMGEVALIAAVATGAFRIACRLYERPTALWD